MEDNQQIQLDTIEAKLDALTENVSLMKQSNDTHSLKKASKTTTALALGLLGAKVGALIGAKSVFVGPIINAVCDGTFKDNDKAWDTIKAVGKSNIVPAMFAGMTGAATVGLATAYIGYKRGDRLKSAVDLIEHPIDSFERLSMSDKTFEQKFPDYFVDSVVEKDRLNPSLIQDKTASR